MMPDVSELAWAYGGCADHVSVASATVLLRSFMSAQGKFPPHFAVTYRTTRPSAAVNLEETLLTNMKYDLTC